MTKLERVKKAAEELDYTPETFSELVEALEDLE